MSGGNEFRFKKMGAKLLQFGSGHKQGANCRLKLASLWHAIPIPTTFEHEARALAIGGGRDWGWGCRGCAPVTPNSGAIVIRA
eukprot:552378-Pelagomonas_calceolata.AAC.2